MVTNVVHLHPEKLAVKLAQNGQPLCHPACLLLPAMSEAELAELTDDIKANGQHHPIIINNVGFILDGRHRWQAAVSLGLEPKLELFTGTPAQEIARVMSENVRRRHLTTKQRAAIAADLATLGRGNPTGSNQYKSKSGKGPNGPFPNEPTVTVAEAAEMMNVSEKSVKRARAVKTKDPKAHEAAKRGVTKPRQAPPQTKVATAIEALKAAGPVGLSRAEVLAAANLKASTQLAAHVVNGTIAMKDGRYYAIEHAPPDVAMFVQPAELPPLPASAQAKLDAYQRRLERDFSQRVEQAAQKKAKEWREAHLLPAYFEKLEKIEQMLSWPRNSVMTKIEYHKVLMCLHPDGLRSRTEDQLAEAFRIFTHYKLKLIKDDEERKRTLSDLPRTVEEMLARKGKRSPR